MSDNIVEFDVGWVILMVGVIIIQMKSAYESGEDVQMIIKTQKQSQSGLFSNQRLLLIKAGIVSYFSSIPKQFIGSYRTIQLSGQIPKFTIAANEISKVELKDNELSFLILKQRLIARNQFQKMVGGDQKLMNERASRNFQTQSSGYQQWIFKCSNQDKLLDFYRLVNMFRTGNPKFQPSLNSVVQGFQAKKNPRKRTIDGNIKTASEHEKRYSEVPKMGNNFMKEEPKKKPLPESPPQPLTPPSHPPQDDGIIPFPLEPEAQLKQSPEPQPEDNEQQRLMKVMNKIINKNEPILDTISEKANEDKNSELSKPKTDEQKPLPIEVIKTFEDSKQNIEESTQKKEDIIREEPEEVTTQVIELQQEQKKQQQAEEEKEVQPKQEQQISKCQESNLKHSMLSMFESQIQFQQRQRKAKKINQLLKACSLFHCYNYKIIAQNIGISEEQLKEFINANAIEEDGCWNFIQTQLGKWLNINGQNSVKENNEIKKDIDMKEEQSMRQETKMKEQIRPVKYELIDEYHDMDILLDNSKLSTGQFLQGELSFESYKDEESQQFEVIEWMQAKMRQANPRPFSSKIISKSQYNIYSKHISFDKNQIIASLNTWIVNQGSPLQQFIAYLYLQRIIRQIMSKQKSNIDIMCGDAIYLKTRDYEAIVKQLKIGYSYLPLKSIRSLQFIYRSSFIKRFIQDFPQFTINVEIIRQGEIFRFHLQRIACPTYRETPIKNQLQRLVFPFDNELDLFVQSSEYSKSISKCLDILHSLQKKQKRISEELLYDTFETIDNNLEIDIICKILGASIDKQNNLFFHPTALKLGHRQFGEQIALIRKARKKGQLQFSQDLGKQVMSKLQYYKLVTPTSNFIQVYLQLTDLLIIQKGELHRAIPVLLKVISFLSCFQLQQYPVYLSLMKTYLRLGEINNFIKVLENCRLFLAHMFNKKAIIFDFPFIRILIMLAMKQNPKLGMEMVQNLINSLHGNMDISEDVKLKYLSRAIWDKCNILIVCEEYEEAYQMCLGHLGVIEKVEQFMQYYWFEGVLCLGKSICQIEDIHAKDCAIVQKRIQRALQLSLLRDNFETTFMLLEVGKKIIQKCKEEKMPKILQNLPAFEQAKIQYNKTCDELIQLMMEEGEEEDEDID